MDEYEPRYGQTLDSPVFQILEPPATGFGSISMHSLETYREPSFPRLMYFSFKSLIACNRSDISTFSRWNIPGYEKFADARAG